jgi:quinoprotein glucose dehydrogenase
VHGGDPGHRQYSPLARIDVSNVERLQVAWVYRTGDARPDTSQIQCNPIVVGSVLYASSPSLEVFALDAATGRARWTFDPFEGGAEQHPLGVNRGVVYWRDSSDGRILFTAGQRLYALNARTGRPIRTFGKGGSVDLRDGLGRDVSELYVLSNTPGAVYRDLLILGTRVSEGPGPSAPGHVRAYDVRTGKVRWTFHTIPHPGEPGHDTWPEDAWKRAGGANVWSGISVDQERGLVFLPTGSAAFDFWGGDRKGANLFANCVLALKAATGERVWHYQLVHHDLWDRDPPAAPVLATLRHGGRSVDAVVQVTKSGHVFTFERESGRALFPIEERPVPPSDLAGEEAWPTQPVPLRPPPFARQALTEAEVTDVSPESRAEILGRLRQHRTGQPFLPPSREGTVIFPGFDGGAEWGGAAFDPDTGVLYVNSNEMPWVLTMVEVQGTKGERAYRQHCVGCHGLDRRGSRAQQVPSLEGLASRSSREDVQKVLEQGKGVMPSFAFLDDGDKDALVDELFGVARAAGRRDPEAPETPYTHTGYNRFLDARGYPAVKPPWGTLNAIDLNEGEILWQVPLGELDELTRRGVAPTGTENYGGPIVTAGGLVFIAATKDEKFRAFDKKTGRVLWETRLPAGGYATPSTYEVDGRQYVVIAAGGGKMGTRSGDAYVAFALP